jgi:hypothetical protein
MMRYYYSNDRGYTVLKEKGLYVRTGEKRPPRKGEWYLSGAIPNAYRAPNDLSIAYHILREATKEETHCSHCHQLLPLD